MKKNIVLSMIALTLLVVPALAEPTFGGAFSYGFHFDIDPDDDGVDSTIFEEGDHNASIEFTAAISDFTSLSAKIKGDDDAEVKVEHMILTQDVTGALGIDGPVAFGFKVGKQSYTPPDYSHFHDPDFTVGIDVVPEKEDKTIYVKDGNTPSDPEHYEVTAQQVKVHEALKDVINGENRVISAKYQGEDSKEIGFVITFDLLEGVLKLDGILYPKSLMDDDEDTTEAGVTLYGSVGPVNYAAYYVKSDRFDASEYHVIDSAKRPVPVTLVDSAGDTIDEEGDSTGLNFDLTFGDFVATVFADYDLDEETAKVAVSAGYTIVGLTATVGADIENIGIEKKDNGNVDWAAKDNLDVDLDLAYAIGGFETKVEFRSSLDDFELESDVKLTLAYTLGDLVLYGAAKMGQFKDFDVKDHLTYEAGLQYTLDSVAFNLGYTNDSDYKAYYDDPDHKKGIYFNVSTSF